MAKNNTVPNHQRIADLLRNRLNQGEYVGLLPTEAALQKEFSVSRSVIRQAISTLVLEGLVVKERGRGTVPVLSHPHRRLIHSLNGVGRIGECMQQGSTTEVVSIAKEKITNAPLCWPNDESLCIKRIRSINGEKVAYIETYIPYQIGKQVDKNELERKSLHQILRDRFDINLCKSQRQIFACRATKNLSTYLNVSLGAPILVLKGTTQTSDLGFTEIFTTYHVGDRFVFDLEINLS